MRRFTAAKVRVGQSADALAANDLAVAIRSISRTGSAALVGCTTSGASAAPGATCCNCCRRARKLTSSCPDNCALVTKRTRGRINRLPAAIHFVMQVRTGGKAGGTDITDHLAAPHPLARAHRDTAHMGIAGAQIAGMAQPHEIAMAAMTPGKISPARQSPHGSVCHCGRGNRGPLCIRR